MGLSLLGTSLNAGQPASTTPPQPTMTQSAPQAPAVPTEPKTTVKISNQSGYNATVTFHYYKIPENSNSTSSVVVENKGSKTIEVLPNTQFSYSVTLESTKSPDVQVNPGDYSSGFYEIRPPATPLLIMRPPVPAPVAPAPMPAPAPAPTLPTPPAPKP